METNTDSAVVSLAAFRKSYEGDSVALVWQCQCGCATFYYFEDGLIECSDCGHKTYSHLER